MNGGGNEGACPQGVQRPPYASYIIEEKTKRTSVIFFDHRSIDVMDDHQFTNENIVYGRSNFLFFWSNYEWGKHLMYQAHDFLDHII